MILPNKTSSVLALLFLLALPLPALAAVEITEVMYDPPGANAGNQWVELTNMGDALADLSGWALFVGGANHKLALAAGTTTLAAGASAVAANNPANFSAEYPAYAGALFKSAFSLASKSGGTIILKDAKAAALDTVTYDPAAGAAGDGNSLHREGNVLAVGAPNLGSSVPTAPLSPAAQSGGTSAATIAPAAKVPRASAAPAVKSASASSGGSDDAAPQTEAGDIQASSPLLSQINLPQGSAAWALGAFELLLLGMSAAWYAALHSRTYGRTVVSAEEFTIEK